jgi:uncharacterized protein (DUF1778 family)
MKKHPEAAKLPAVTAQEAAAAVRKQEVIFLRVTAREKEAIKQAAMALRLSITEYLLRCHGLVAEKLNQRGKKT